MSQETWIRVVGFDQYEVSDLGRVRRVISRTCSKAGAIINGHVGKHGYIYFNVTIDGKRKSIKHHRLVCEAFHGPAPTPAHVVAHCNGNRLDNRAANLRWATTKENHSDRYAHGTNPAGSRNGRATLCEAQIAEIRRLYSLVGRSAQALAEQYETPVSTMQKIVRRETWKHVA